MTILTNQARDLAVAVSYASAPYRHFYPSLPIGTLRFVDGHTAKGLHI